MTPVRANTPLTLAAARGMDADDPLSALRAEFCPARCADGRPAIYFCGNSLGLQPKTARQLVNEELDDWAELGVDAHFAGRRPWYPYHEQFRASGARLVGAQPGEVVFMNGLTVNLHLAMTSFYRPTPARHAILMEACAFPSDTYAARTQIAFHGYQPSESLIIAQPREGEHTLRMDDVEALIERNGARIALVLFAGVNYFTGQVFDLSRIAAAAHRQGCRVGFDLAHAAGNVPLCLHDWNVDFAVWCTYKYLNCGPGAVAGLFVHEQHARDSELRRLGGWWGNDPATRFRMHLQPDFVPVPGAEGWQLSNPPILAMAPLKASLDIFDSVGMPALRDRSVRLTAFLQRCLDAIPHQRYTVITPRPEHARGCQLSILVHERPRELLATLHAQGVVCDFREPDVIRVAPTPLYNTFEEVWTFADILARHV